MPCGSLPLEAFEGVAAGCGVDVPGVAAAGAFCAWSVRVDCDCERELEAKGIRSANV